MMAFDSKLFFQNFQQEIEDSRRLRWPDLTPTQKDTQRVFLAADAACGNQAEYFRGDSRYRGKKHSREFLCDYTYYNQVGASHGEVVLALESEWGNRGGPSLTKKKVLEDFVKIVSMLAPVKIMVFAYNGKENEADIKQAMADILSCRTLQSANEHVLAISCPWYDVMRGSTLRGYQWSGQRWVEFETLQSV